MTSKHCFAFDWLHQLENAFNRKTSGLAQRLTLTENNYKSLTGGSAVGWAFTDNDTVSRQLAKAMTSVMQGSLMVSVPNSKRSSQVVRRYILAQQRIASTLFNQTHRHSKFLKRLTHGIDNQVTVKQQLDLKTAAYVSTAQLVNVLLRLSAIQLHVRSDKQMSQLPSLQWRIRMLGAGGSR